MEQPENLVFEAWRAYGFANALQKILGFLGDPVLAHRAT